MTVHDLVLSGGRVIDPESGLDAVRDVGITGDTVREISSGLAGSLTVDASGLVVCPGFVDLHSHSQDIPGQRLQALDGVTTALELEAGALPVDQAYRRAAVEGRPVNYGFSTSWAARR
jgi:predicted amidohydrolase